MTNAGPDTALNAVVTDVLPTTLDFVSATGCTFASATHTVTCNLGAVTTAGASLTIVTTPNSSGSITNTASVAASTVDANSANNSATATSAVASAGGADLGVTTSIPTKITVGTGFSILAHRHQSRSKPKPVATLTDTLPAQPRPPVR